MNVLACQQLGKTYWDGKGAVQVLHGINFSIKRDHSVAIVGASGSGKSTFLHLLGGLDQASSGRIFWRDQEIDLLSEKERCLQRNQRIGFVYQFHHLLPEFTALENVALPLLIRGQSSTQAQKRAREILSAVGLEKRMQRKFSELSGGERQRTAIARALVTEPDCVLADEPTGNLDQHTAEQVLTVMLDLQQQVKTSFIIATHDRTLASRLKQCYCLSDGQLAEN